MVGRHVPITERSGQAKHGRQLWVIIKWPVLKVIVFSSGKLRQSWLILDKSLKGLNWCKHSFNPKGQCKPHGLGIILGESWSKLLLHGTKWGF